MIILVLSYNSGIKLTRYCSSDVSCSSTIFLWSSIRIYINLSLYFIISQSSTVKKETWLSHIAFPLYTRRIYPNLCSYFINKSNFPQTYKYSPISRKLLCVLLWECVPIYSCTEVERGSLSTLLPKQEDDPKKLGWTSDKWLNVIITRDSAGAAEGGGDGGFSPPSFNPKKNNLIFRKRNSPPKKH